jgi:hypothetical protein|tara:strand:- start:445 stop:768 length:324 start_codon:yes stop_codon:yes gene_type:complete
MEEKNNMADYKNKPKDPNWVCTFQLKRNADKDPSKPETKNRPDFVLVNSEKKNKKGDFFKKNFTVHGNWCEASGYIQDDKSLKITIKKTGTIEAAPQQGNDGFMDQF